MSCYEWEDGSFIIPSSQWTAFKKNIRDHHNRTVERDFNIATRLVATAQLAGKGKRGVNWRGLIYRLYYDTFAPRGDVFESQHCEDIINRLISQQTGKLVAPKKMDFPLANSTTTQYRNLDASVRLDDKTRTAHWHVPENNHACEHARESALGRAFFNSLSKVTWTRGSGGFITGNNEYNREDRDVGGGANLLKDTFGPLGEKARDEHYNWGRSPARNRRSTMRY